MSVDGVNYTKTTTKHSFSCCTSQLFITFIWAYTIKYQLSYTYVFTYSSMGTTN